MNYKWLGSWSQKKPRRRAGRVGASSSLGLPRCDHWPTHTETIPERVAQRTEDSQSEKTKREAGFPPETRPSPKQKPRQEAGLRWVHYVSCQNWACRSLRRTASPLPQRQAAQLVARSAEDQHEKAPPGRTGLSWSRLSDGACRRGAKSSAASRHPNAEPHRWLHSARPQNPPEAGLS